MNYKAKLKDIKALFFDCDGVLTDGSITLFPDGIQTRTMNVKDGFAIQVAARKKYILAIITGARSKEIKNRFNDLGVTEVYLNCVKKIDTFNRLLNKYNLKSNHVLYMGDDIPDIEVLKNVGLSCCPSDAIYQVKKIVDYISPLKGGNGCVRDVIEQVLKIQQKWPDEIHT